MGIVSSDEDSALIYGLEAVSRTLSSAPSSADQSIVRFVVGTRLLSPADRPENEKNTVSLLEFGEESHSLSKAVFHHETGEIISLSSSPNPKTPLLATCSLSQSTSDTTTASGVTRNCSLFRFPIDLSAALVDEESVVNDLDIVWRVSDDAHAVLWKPDEEANDFLTLGHKSIDVWDCGRQAQRLSLPALIPTSSSASRLQSTVRAVKWSPHSNASILGLNIGTAVVGLDMRQKADSPHIWSIAGHNHCVRDCDFNPNAQYVMATVGDDCELRLWDVRKPSAPVVSFLSHRHWIWSVRFNAFHDQLILTCSSDASVILTRVTSHASQPFGHLIADSSDDEVIAGGNGMRAEDGVVAEFEEHEDSVYCAEWATADPWIAASLSYDGRLVLHKVPKAEKMDLLF